MNNQEIVVEMKKKLEEERKHYRVISLDELYEMEFPESAWTIKGMVPSEGITIISGAPSSFKSWLTMLMALSIAKGKEFLGSFETQQGNVLMIDEENHLRDVKRRMEQLGGEGDLPISFLSQEGFLVRNEIARKKVLKICEDEDIGTVIIDSLVRVNEADENVSSQMALFFRDLKEFCKAGITVILIHHNRKGGITRDSVQSRLRGSTEILAAVDSHISVKKERNDKNIIIVEQSKLRSGKEFDPFEIVVSDQDEKVLFEYFGGHSETQSKQDSASVIILSFLEDFPNGANVNEVVKAVRFIEAIGDKTVRNALKKLIKDGSVLEKAGQKNEKICYLPSPAV